MNEFLLSDESVNSHGYVIQTSGIKLERFNANPVMYLNHNMNKGIAGKWTNLRIHNGKLFGTPVFDMEHEPGKTAGEQAGSGFLNGASIGIENVVFAQINGVETAISCELIEVSVCDIPSNKNALQLYYDGTPVTLSKYQKLSANKNDMGTTNLQCIALALSLPEEATVNEICNAIKTMRDAFPDSVSLMMDNAIKRHLITKEEGDELLTLASSNPVSLSKYLQRREEANRNTLSASYDQFVSENHHKFIGFHKDEKLKQLALHDLDTFKRFTGLIQKPIKPTDVLNLSNNESNKSEWTLEDYRRKAPQMLAKDPGLYQKLIHEDKERQLNK